MDHNDDDNTPTPASLLAPPRLDPEALKTFVIVADSHSFSAAAKVLEKTTAAISYRIRNLEETVGASLFHRTTRSVSLTPAGELLLQRATQIFEWMQTLPAELKQLSAGVEATFSFVINNLLYDTNAVADLLNFLYQSYPHTRFAAYRGVYMGVWDQLLIHNAQLAIGAPGWHSVNETLETMPLGQINWRFVISLTHPLIKEEEPFSDMILRRYPAINVEDTSEIFHKKRIAWRLSGQKEIIVPDMRTKVGCHYRGLGIGFLPRQLAEMMEQKGRLTIRRVVYGRNPSPLSLAWNKASAGEITKKIYHLFETKAEIIRPFLTNIDPSDIS